MGKKYSESQTRLAGQTYISKNKIRHAKIREYLNCDCKYKCTSKIDNSAHELHFRPYYSLKDVKQQKAYALVDELEVQRRRVETGSAENSRTNSRYYYLMNGKERYRVCLPFFPSAF